MQLPPNSTPARLRACTPLGLIAVLLLQVGCTSMSGLGGKTEFKCSAPSGVPCQSVSGVHANYRAGTLPYQRAAEGQPAHAGQEAAGDPAVSPDEHGGGGGTAAIVSDAKLPAATPRRYAEPASPGVVRALGAIRSEPTVVRIWTAPWEDGDGDLHDQGYMYLQIDAGRWLIEHNRAQIRQAFGPKVSLSGTGARSSTTNRAISSAASDGSAAKAAAAALSALPEGDDMAAAAAKGAALAEQILRGARMANPTPGEVKP